ncbi:hypothetical protein GN956_G11984 [Arapaima gigas]
MNIFLDCGVSWISRNSTGTWQPRETTASWSRHDLQRGLKLKPSDTWPPLKLVCAEQGSGLQDALLHLVDEGQARQRWLKG